MVDEPVTVVVAQKGWVRALQGPRASTPRRSPSRPATGSTAPSRAAASIRCWSSAATAACTRCRWRCCRAARGDGQPITTLIELEAGTQPVHYFAGAAERDAAAVEHRRLRLARARSATWSSRQRGGKGFLDARARASSRCRRASPTAGARARAPASRWAGACWCSALDELKLQPNGGRGLTLIDLDARRRAGQRRRLRRGAARAGQRPRRQAEGGGAEGRARSTPLRGPARAQGPAVGMLKAQRVLSGLMSPAP